MTERRERMKALILLLYFTVAIVGPYLVFKILSWR